MGNYIQKFLGLLSFLSILSVNSGNAQTNVSGTISTNTNWVLGSSPYIVKGNLLISSGVTLTIDPGVVVKFDENIGILVNGKIIADGNSANQILFTSNNSTPNAGDWSSIRLSTTATPSVWDINKIYLSGSKFSYCKFEYAGNSAIYSEVSLYVDNSTFLNNKNWGEYRKGIWQPGTQYYYAGGALTLKGGTSVIKKSLFYNNQSDNGYGHGFGGAIYTTGGDIMNCIFFKNIALSNGEGGGVFAAGNTNTINNCSFINNIGAYNGSSIGVGSEVTSIYNSTFYSKNITGNGLLSNNINGGIIINNSNFLTDENYILKNRNTNTLDARLNFWSPVYINSISDKIFDFTNLSSLGSVDVSSKLNSIQINAPITSPRNVAKNIVGGRVVINWTSNTESDVTGYKVYYGGYTGYSYTNSIDVGNLTTTTLPAGVGINEEIAITAYDASKTGTDDQLNGNESWYSTASTIPNAPTTVVADSGPRRIKLTWAASTSSGVNNYNIYRSTDNSTYSNIGSTISLNFIDSLITPNTKYYYKLTAFDSLDLSYSNYGLESVFSNIINGNSNRITYVSPSGNNNNIGSLTSPKLTIANSVTNSLAGDTVLLNRGTYNEVVDLKGKISLLSSLYINTGDTNDISSTILSGSTTGNNTLIINTGTPSIASFHIYALTIQDVRLQVVNLSSGNDSYKFKLSKSVIKNSGTYGQWGVIGTGNNGILDSCTIFGNKGRYIVSSTNLGSVGPVISNNTFYANSSSADGATYEEVSAIHIERKARVINNLLFKNLTTAIDFGGNGSDSMIFINNTITLNKGYGIRFQTWGGVYSGIVLNNISRFNTQKDISCNTQTNGPGVYLKNNFFGTAGSTFGTGLNSVNNTILDTTGNIGGDPYFVDTLNNNYRLKSQSRAIGAGASHTYPNAKDIEGNDRINSWRVKPDIGAFESSYKFTSPLLIKTEPGNKKVALFWTQVPNTNIKAYKVYRSTSRIPDNSTSTFIADVTGVDKLIYIDESTEIVNGTTYYYRLRAVHNDNSLSGLSNELTAIPADVPIPSNFKLNNSPSKTRLNWTSVGLTSAKYQLFRGVNLNSKILLVDSLNAITYEDVTFARNTTYYYWIKAINATGALSEFSEPIILTPTNIWQVDSATGNDVTGIGSSILPYKMMQLAIDNSIDGDTIFVKPGTYNESILINKAILLKSVGGYSKTKIIKETSLGYAIKAIGTFNNPYRTIKIQGFNIKSNGIKNGIGIRTEQRAYTEIDSVFVEDFETALSTYYGYYLVRNSVFNKNRIYSWNDAGDADKTPISQHVTVLNTSNAVNLAGENIVNKFYNSIFVNDSNYKHESNIESLFQGPRVFLYDVIIDKPYSPASGSRTLLVKNAQELFFTDLEKKDFSLRNYSPAIGFGTLITGLNNDIQGNNRILPVSSSPDAGAFENNFGHPAPFINSDSSRNGLILLKLTQTPVGTVNKINIYKGLNTSPTTKYKDTSLVSRIIDSTNTIFNKVIFYRLTSMGASNLESGYSNEVRTISFTPPSLNFPVDLSIKTDTNINFQWEKIENATSFKLQYSTDSNFISNVIELTKKDTFNLKNGLVDNTTYFWRVQTQDSIHFSKWSKFKRFQTFVRNPILNSITTDNRVITIKWSLDSLRNIKAFKIYRGTGTNPTTKIDSISSSILTYSDSIPNGVKYFYRVTAVNTDNVESSFSNELNGNSFGVTLLDSPSNNRVKEILTPTFKWQPIEFATKYNIQISNDSVFSNFLIDTVTTLTSLTYTKRLSDNTTYYWRVRVGDSKGYGNWTNKSSFQTFIPNPILNTITSVNRVIAISWSVNSLRNIKAFKIYRGTGTNPTTKIDSISSSILTYSDSIPNGVKYFYRVTAVNTDNVESSFSNELNGNSFGVTLLDSPSNNRVKEVLTPTFKWQPIEFATKYNIQISNDSVFSNFLIDTVTTLTSLTYTKRLSDNTTYYWRVRVGDGKGYGNWTNISSFQTFITSPVLLSIFPGNKVDTLKWSIGSSKNIKYFKIYADTVTNPTKLKDSISGLLDTYIDKVNLLLNVKYFYRIVAGNQQNIESDFSNILNVIPVNASPKAIKLINKSIQNAGEFNFVKFSYSSNGSIDNDGKITSFNWYVNDSLVNKTDSVLNYFFKLGTNTIKLIVIDNDGGKDSSLSVLNISSLQKVFPAGILGGISAINPNYILTADTSFNNTTGSSVSILDRSGNTIFPIVVQSKIFTTPSISSDTSIFITNGSNLNGYSKSGVSLWPTIPLGGISYVTPTIDSNFNRIYVGVSNKNFFAYDYKTGKNVWSIICDAPINTSAVITGDRKLIFTSQAGTLYGFDISKSDIQTTPKWKMSFGDIITKSPAVDASSNIYVGTNAGRLIKFMLNTDGSVSVKWNVNIGSAIQTSPVIDADSNIYVGTEKGDFYKINRFNGSTIWSYNVGAAIYSTPNISEYGTIYVSNMNGLVTAITTDKRVLWKYQDIGPISANSLYINNMLYIASEKGSFTGIYDNPNSVNVNTSISSTDNSISSSLDNFSTSKIINPSSTNISTSTNLITPRMPVWGTFQGDYRRTGSLSLICPTSLSISRTANGNLISNTPNYIQWYKDGSEILNATDSIFKPTLAGNYFIKNNQAGCNTVSSNSYYYLVTDIINLNKDEFIKLTPNPFINFMNIDFVLKGYQRMNIEVFSASTGAKVAIRIGVTAGSRLIFNELSPGIYFVRIASPDMKVSHQFKIVKL